MPDSQLPPLWGPALRRAGPRRRAVRGHGQHAGGAPAGREHPGRAPRGRNWTRALRRGGRQGRVPRVRDRDGAAARTAPAAWTAAAEHPAVTAHTLILARPTNGGRPPGGAGTGTAARARRRPQAGHRGDLRRRGRPDRGRGGGHRRPGRSSARSRHPSGVSPPAPARRPARPGRHRGRRRCWRPGPTSERTASPKATAPTPTAPRPTADPGSMCRQYFGDFVHRAPAGRAAGRASAPCTGSWPRWRAVAAGQDLGYCLHLRATRLRARGRAPAGTDGGHGAQGWRTARSGAEPGHQRAVRRSGQSASGQRRRLIVGRGA